MSTSRTFVIVGAGLAGAKAAETLRQEGFTGRVVLLGEESERPYDRPPLSKGYLRGEDDRGEVYLHDAGFYADQGIELVTSTRVTAVDPNAGDVVLDSGERLGYDRLLLATGADPRRLPLPGGDLAGVHYLRRLDDAERLGAAIRSAERVVVVGGGWIGSEVAASARQMGAEVALVAPSSVPLERVLGTEVGAVFRDLHADRGMKLHLGTNVEGIVGLDYAEGVRTADGAVVQGDLVVVGVGAIPRVELAQPAGLAVGNGIEVDAFLETSVAGIFAAGDVASAWHPNLGARIRVEHWATATHQGETAARNMLGKAEPYGRIPYFFSDQYDLGMEYTGYAPEWDEVVFRGDPASLEFVAFWMAGGRPVAGMNVNVWDVAEPIEALVRSGPVDRQRLADPTVPLEEL
jgi:3-phenylpropionate/trans-cinnamate dioxygenase ferredoxin reductase subunit